MNADEQNIGKNATEVEIKSKIIKDNMPPEAENPEKLINGEPVKIDASTATDDIELYKEYEANYKKLKEIEVRLETLQKEASAANGDMEKIAKINAEIAKEFAEYDKLNITVEKQRKLQLDRKDFDTVHEEAMEKINEFNVSKEKIEEDPEFITSSKEYFYSEVNEEAKTISNDFKNESRNRYNDVIKTKEVLKSYYKNWSKLNKYKLKDISPLMYDVSHIFKLNDVEMDEGKAKKVMKASLGVSKDKRAKYIKDNLLKDLSEEQKDTIMEGIQGSVLDLFEVVETFSDTLAKFMSQVNSGKADDEYKVWCDVDQMIHEFSLFENAFSLKEEQKEMFDNMKNALLNYKTNYNELSEYTRDFTQEYNIERANSEFMLKYVDYYFEQYKEEKTKDDKEYNLLEKDILKYRENYKEIEDWSESYWGVSYRYLSNLMREDRDGNGLSPEAAVLIDNMESYIGKNKGTAKATVLEKLVKTVKYYEKMASNIVERYISLSLDSDATDEIMDKKNNNNDDDDDWE